MTNLWNSFFYFSCCSCCSCRSCWALKLFLAIVSMNTTIWWAFVSVGDKSILLLKQIFVMRDDRTRTGLAALGCWIYSWDCPHALDYYEVHDGGNIIYVPPKNHVKQHHVTTSRPLNIISLSWRMVWCCIYTKIQQNLQLPKVSHFQVTYIEAVITEIGQKPSKSLGVARYFFDTIYILGFFFWHILEGDSA